MSQYFMPIYTTVVGMIIGALATWVKSLVDKRKKKQDIENGLIDALKDGMAILLRQEIRDYYNEYEYKEEIPVSDWEEIEATHNVYKKLNDNHSGDRMYEELKSKHLQGE